MERSLDGLLDKYFPLYTIAFVFTFLITAAIERALIPALRGHANQPIYMDGPVWHAKKSGTPTMGGLAFLIASSLSLSAAAAFLFLKGERGGGLSLLLALGFSILNALIGILDDLKKLRKRENEGLSPREKLFFQTLISALYLSARAVLIPNPTALSFSFGRVDIGFLYYPIAMFILLGIVNCANLTDGIDGLAGSVAFAIGISLFYISCALSYEVAFLSAVMIGAALGFLMFNLHPAKIFMGDTGSLFFGALAASAAISLGNPIIIISIGGIYVIEGISVILQVAFFKMTKKRIFRMAPLHHHFEKCGYTENKICILAVLVTLLLSIPAYIIYLP